MLKTASKPVDVQDLQFKLQCRLKISDSKEGTLKKTPLALLASASRYGLVFVGCISSKLKVFRFENVEEISSIDSTTNYARREITLISQPYNICVNCDHTILGVVIEKDNCLVALFYDILSFYKENIVLLNEVRLSSTPGLQILQANWHPTISNIYTVCKSDGTLGIYELQGNSFEVKNLPSESRSSCFCWSPKGKQIAVGSQDGKIFHYKPDLKAVKTIDAPLFEKPHDIISLQWISNYQFIGVFKMCNEPEPECSVILIDAPKTGNPTFTNFNDICYSNGSLRPPQFFLIAEQNWNILLVASANSMEVGVLSNAGEIWTQCILPDSARAELPLDTNQDETYPVGMTVDTSSVKPVLWGESYLQPAPSLLLLSHEGILCCFRMINLKEGAANINCAPEKINDMSGLKYFSTPLQETSSQTSSSNVTPNVQKIADAEKNLTAATAVSTPNPNSHGLFPLANSTLLATTQGLQTPTRPLLFGAPISRQSFSPHPTNMIGNEVSITPVKTKEPALPTSAVSKGAMLLSKIISESESSTAPPEGSVQRKEADHLAFSNVLAGPASAAMNINATFKNREFSVGSIETNSNASTKNKEAVVQSSVGPTMKSAVSNSSTLWSSGSNQVQKGNISIPNSTTTQNIYSDSQKRDENPGVGSLGMNTIQLQTSGKVEKEEEGLDMKNMLTKMLQIERSALDKEIQELLIQGQHLRINLDSKEMEKLVHSTENIHEFLKDLCETCEIQNSEVHILKQNTIQSWAWMEEARSRLKESQNEELRSVIKSKPLDSVSEKHLITLKQLQFYLNSQLTQSHKALDDQWDKFQDFCRKTNRVQLPTMEAIFQTMVKQDAVLQKHNYILNDIKSQIKGKQKVSNKAALFIPFGRDDELESSFQNIKSEAESIYHIYYQKVLNRVKSLPKQKTNQLRKILHNREVPHVMVKSQLSTSELHSSVTSNQQSNMSLKTPVGKKTGNSQFFQSSPLNISSNIQSHISSTPLPSFSSSNNIVSSGKPELFTRNGTELQKGVASSISEFNTGRVPPKNSNIANSMFPEKKQSQFLQNQNSLFEAPTTTMNENVLNISSKSIEQASHQNIQDRRFLATSTSQTQQLVTEPSVSISSATTNSRSDTPNKIFSFVSSAPQLNNFTSSAKVVFSSTTITGNSTSSGGSITTNTTPSTLVGTVFSKSTVSSTLSSGKTTSSSGLSFSNNFLGCDSSSSTQSLFPKNTGSSMSGSSVAPKSGTFAPASSNGGCEMASDSTKTGSQTAPTSVSIFGAGTETSGNSTNNKFFVTSETGSGSVHSTAPTTVPIFGAATETSGDSMKNKFSFVTSETGSGSVHSTAPTTAPIFGAATETSGDSTKNKFSFVTSETGSSGVHSTAPTTVPIFGAATGTSGDSTKNKFSFVTSETGSSSVHSTAPTIFGAATETSRDSTKNKFSFVTSETGSSGAQSTSIDSILATSTNSLPTNTTSIFQNSTSSSQSSGVLSAHSKSSHFGNNIQSSESVQTSAHSLFNPLSNKENLPTSGTSIFGTNSKNSFFTNIGSVNTTPFTSTTTNCTTGESTTSTINNSVPTTAFPSTSVPNSGQALSVPNIFGTNDNTVQASNKPTFSTPVSNNEEIPVTNQSLPASTSSCDKMIPAAPVSTSATSGETVSSASKSIFSTSKASDGALSLTSRSIFGNINGGPASISKTATPSVANPLNFNTSSNTSVFTSSSFGATTPGSIFGNPASVAVSSNNTVKSVFGTSSSESSPFSVSAAPVQTSQFNDPFSSDNSSKSPFGQISSVPPSFGTSSVATSPFSSAAMNVQSPLFGAKPSGTNSPFGATPSANSPFGTQAFRTGFDSNTSIQSSPFDKGSAESNTFGSSNQTSSVFGTVNSTKSSTSPVGQNSNASTGLFGAFGSSTAKNAEESLGFGNLNMGSTAQSSFLETNDTKSPFRGTPFNPTSSTGSLFGSSTLGNNNSNSVFGQPTFGNNSAFGGNLQSGPFSGGAGSIAQTGFGVLQNSQKTTAFGAAPTFGGTPAFGSAPTFGGAPTFGNASSFGSPNKIFGSPNPSTSASVFGSANQQSAGFGSFANQNSLGFGNLAQPSNPGETQSQASGFENFASQNTIGFGSLAQQTMNSGQNTPFSGNSSFSSWR